MTRPGKIPAGSRRLKERLKSGKQRSVSSKAWLERQLNDPYVAEAKRLGYRSRSAFKLIEIDDKYHILKSGQRVVDLGASPGGWSQVSAERIKAGDGSGKVIALDMHRLEPLAGVTIVHKDILEDDAPSLLLQELGSERADVVLSDMAAHATGHRQTDHLKIMALAEAALDFAEQVLRPGGSFLAKVLQGGSEEQFLNRLKSGFAQVRHVKPRASREDSAELFVLAQGFRGGN